MQLSGFAPHSRITVDSDYDEVECPSGKLVTGAHWTEPYGTYTDANGRLTIDYLHEATGSYRYTFTDKLGNQASLPFTTEREPTATPRVKATAAATPTSEPTAAPDPQAVVQSATLNLRGGPDQGYPVVGQLARGDKMYPVARVGQCQWIQVGVLGRDELAWVAGASKFVTLNVPCDSLMAVDDMWPTPEPVPTAAVVESPRPATGLLSRSGNTGPGVLRIKNGTDGDGVVILVTEAGNPVQAAYIRAGESYEMMEIGDGNYRLFFAKGDGWNAEAKQFARNVTRQRFEDTMVFGGEYAGYEVTLYGVAGGNAATEDVPAGQFPSLP